VKKNALFEARLLDRHRFRGRHQSSVTSSISLEVILRKRGTTPFWLKAIIKKGSYPFFGLLLARQLVVDRGGRGGR
jgi:hypothetical protein